MSIKLNNTTMFGIHTGIVSHRISKREMRAIKLRLGLQPTEAVANNQTYYQKGITNLSIKEVEQRFNDQIILRCTLELELNFARILGLGEYCLMPYTIQNINKVIYHMVKVLKDIGVEGSNANFMEWKVERIDTAFDVTDTNVKYLMNVISRTINRDCFNMKRLRILYPFSEESCYFGNDSYVWNIYDKYNQLMSLNSNSDKNLVEADRMRNILRFERQNKKGAIQRLLKNKKFLDLKETDTRKKILTSMAEELKMFFGKNELPEVEEAALTSDDYDCSGIYYRIFKKIDKESKRKKNIFPIPHYSNVGRYHSNITIYSCANIQTYFDKYLSDPELKEGYKTEMKSVAGRTLDDYEEKVYVKLYDCYIENLSYCLGWNKESCYEAIFGKYHDSITDVEEDIGKFYQLCLDSLVKSFNAIIKFGEVAETKVIKDNIKSVKRIIHSKIEDNELYNTFPDSFPQLVKLLKEKEYMPVAKTKIKER